MATQEYLKYVQRYNLEWFNKLLEREYLDKDNDEVKEILSCNGNFSDEQLIMLKCLITHEGLPYNDGLEIVANFIEEFRGDCSNEKEKLAESRLSFMLSHLMPTLQCGNNCYLWLSNETEEIESKLYEKSEIFIEEVKAPLNTSFSDLEKYFYDMYDYAFTIGPKTSMQEENGAKRLNLTKGKLN